MNAAPPDHRQGALTSSDASRTAERELVGHLLGRGTEALDEIASIGVGPEDFADDACAAIWRAASELPEVTLAALDKRLRLDGAMGPVQDAGGLEGLSRRGAGSAADAATHVVEASKRRKLTRVLARLTEESRGCSDVGAFASVAEAAIAEVADRDTTGGAQHISTYLRGAMENIVRDLKGDQPRAVRTGIAALDARMSPMLPEQVIVIGAPTGGGKSALATTIAENACVGGDASAYIASLEMGGDELADRMMFAIGGVDKVETMSRRSITQDEIGRLTDAGTKLQRSGIWVDPSASATEKVLRSRIRRWARARRRTNPDAKLIAIVDYIQLITPSKADRNREQEIAKISREMKIIAKECGIPVVALTQLNADGETRESRAIHQDADKFIVVRREESGTADDAKDEFGNQMSKPTEMAEIVVKKNRGGRQGIVQVVFVAKHTKFTDVHRSGR